MKLKRYKNGVIDMYSLVVLLVYNLYGTSDTN